VNVHHLRRAANHPRRGQALDRRAAASRCDLPLMFRHRASAWPAL